MTGWSALLSSLIGGLLALAGVLLAQMWAMRRDRDARLWTRQADAYVALMRWRLSPPDDVAIADPEQLAEAEQDWKENAYPLLAELSLFGGPDLQAVFKQSPYLFQAVDQLAKIRPGELAEVVRADITAGTQRSSIKRHQRLLIALARPRRRGERR
jgi:hypothetical protein